MPVQEKQDQKNVGSGIKGESQHVKSQAQTPAQTQSANGNGGQRVETLPAGIANARVEQDGIEKVERAVPADQPPPLPVNADLTWIGKPVPRLDGPLKTTG